MTGAAAAAAATVIVAVTLMVVFPMVVSVATATRHLSAAHHASIVVAEARIKVEQVETEAVVRVLVPCLVQVHLVATIRAVAEAVRLVVAEAPAALVL